ncbi:MAG TPA: tyrosine-protein phosphatase [Aggregatilineaceae bacterium]|nr:tyrosine-protein phosphatase [Aggregatilineaceae bacterium]
MTRDRRLTWDGCTNVRDLGGLQTVDGRVTRWGALVRSDHPANLTSAGWSALYDYGIRTIITLTTHGYPESKPDLAPRPADLITLSCAIEDFTDEEFVEKWVLNELVCSPLYYSEALRRWPALYTAVIEAIARARPGGVLFHCIRGVDRTGIIALLLLALVGVVPEDILTDYALTPDAKRDELLAREHTTTRETILTTLAHLDAARYLLDSGLSEADLTAVRAHLLNTNA